MSDHHRKFDNNGVPLISSPLEYIEGFKARYTRVKYTKWENDKKPWIYYPEKGTHSSSEIHFLYDSVKRLGDGNYANLGVHKGASTAAIAFGLQEIKGKGKVYGVDIFRTGKGKKNIAEKFPEMIEDHFKTLNLINYLELCKGFTFEWAEKLAHKRFKLVFIDADHHYESCKLDFELWSPLVEVGGEVAFHDINMISVDRVIREMGPGWEEVDCIYKLKSFRKK